MGYTEEELTTLGDVWELFKQHGLEGKWCPYCDQFSQARVLLKQDQLISAMYEALKLTRGNLQTLSDATLHYKKTFSSNLGILNKILAEVEEK